MALPAAVWLDFDACSAFRLRRACKTGKAVVESVEEKIDDSIDPKNINEIRIEKLDKDNVLNETSEVNDLQDNLAKN